jgi:hypothetical protein
MSCSVASIIPYDVATMHSTTLLSSPTCDAYPTHCDITTAIAITSIATLYLQRVRDLSASLRHDGTLNGLCLTVASMSYVWNMSRTIGVCPHKAVSPPHGHLYNLTVSLERWMFEEVAITLRAFLATGTIPP